MWKLPLDRRRLPAVKFLPRRGQAGAPPQSACNAAPGTADGRRTVDAHGGRRAGLADTPACPGPPAGVAPMLPAAAGPQATPLDEAAVVEDLSVAGLRLTYSSPVRPVS